jgi:mycothiol synthase
MRHREIAGEVGSARVERIPTGWSVDLEGAEGPESTRQLLDAALAAIADEGGGLARLWVRAGDPAVVAAAVEAGFAEERSLHQLRRPLPVGEPWSIAVRPFVIGRDEDAWLAVNNRAFDWHPEQGGWTRADLESRFAEPWFDPAGFLLHEVDGELLGFCWTKEHRDVDPALGEIYVIAVDPSAGGRGLGRELTLAGLDHLHAQGISLGMLYVDGSNSPALALYDRLGFDVHQTDTAWTTEVRP